MSDALSDILRSVRMEGAVFSRAALNAPWGVESGELTTGVFHAVVRGRAWARLAGDDEFIELAPGDVVFMPFGDNHLLTDRPDSSTRPIGALTTTDSRGMGHLAVEGVGPHTSLICGTVAFDQGGAHPVFSLLPSLLHVHDPDGRVARVTESLITLIADEVDRADPGTETIVARLTDVLIVYMLRAYIAGLEPGEGGWLGGLKDPGICEALGLIHRSPERNWKVAELAAGAAMSRSAFFSRFRDLVGETPAEYLTRWRIHVASRYLRDDGLSASEAGRRVGYSTEAAFSNAFLRVMGVRPGAYKRAA